ncbi:hypothetical protein I204_01496 [Kwoniella mangroviensis CBS 8886]|nr:hypothetical protein I204_01496 [Kwoniella mangroviensis CBS 8886]
MVLVGLLPILAFAGTIQAAAIPVDSTPPASPALSLPAGGGSATFSPVPTFSPQLGVPSPTFPNAPSFDNTPDAHQNTSGGGRYTQDGSQGGLRSGTGVGRGKGMTNAERMRRGLGILPPTRRMTGKPSRRSGIPNGSPQVDAAQFQSPITDGDVVTTPTDGSVAETSLPDNNNQNQGPDQATTDTNTNTDDNSNDATNDQDQSQPSDINQSNNDTTNNDNDNDQTADINNGRVLASKKYAMRMTNPEDGSDMGLITGPQGDDNPLIGYSPSPSDPLQMTMLNNPSSNSPFSIVPNTDSPGDDSTFKGPRKLLAAVPHRTSTDPGSGDLMPGNGNYAPLGMGWKDGSGLLHINIQALINHPSSSIPGSSLPLPGSDYPTSDLPVDPSTVFGAPKQLLSRPGGSVLPSTDSLPVDTSNLPVGSSSDPTSLMHGTVSNLPLGGGSFGDPQDTLWTFEKGSNKLLAQYVNSDGSTVPTYFVTGGDCSHTICLTADVNAFKDAQGDGAHEVHVLAEALADL